MVGSFLFSFERCYVFSNRITVESKEEKIQLVYNVFSSHSQSPFSLPFIWTKDVYREHPYTHMFMVCVCVYRERKWNIYSILYER